MVLNSVSFAFSESGPEPCSAFLVALGGYLLQETYSSFDGDLSKTLDHFSKIWSVPYRVLQEAVDFTIDWRE